MPSFLGQVRPAVVADGWLISAAHGAPCSRPGATAPGPGGRVAGTGRRARKPACVYVCVLQAASQQIRLAEPGDRGRQRPLSAPVTACSTHCSSGQTRATRPSRAYARPGLRPARQEERMCSPGTDPWPAPTSGWPAAPPPDAIHHTDPSARFNLAEG